MWTFLLYLLIYVKSLLEDARLPNAYAKMKKWIFDNEFPGNLF